MNLPKHVFLVGIKGVAMANIAVILKKMGVAVSGSDLRETFITDDLLKKNGIAWTVGFSPDDLPSHCKLVLYSAAHGGTTNPQVATAAKRGITIMHQAEFLGKLTSDFETTIAVSGCHGKTTTSALLADSLIKLGARPSYLVGAPFFGERGGSDFQDKRFFVIEADEYGLNPPSDRTPKFLFLNPTSILCTNIDFDHPDVYRSLEDVKEAYIRFFGAKKLFLCLDDPELRSLLSRLKNTIVTYGFDKNASVRVTSWKTVPTGSVFEVESQGKRVGTFTTQLFGKKNVLNAAGVIAVLLDLGFTPPDIEKSLSGFAGAMRRFSLVYRKNGTYLFDDYAHHPNEIKATIEASRNRFPKNRIIVVFQPHTYSRTAALLRPFAQALGQADVAIVLPIFPSAREDAASFSVDSAAIEKIAHEEGYTKIVSLSSRDALAPTLTSLLKRNDVVLTLGAGDVYTAKNDIMSIIDTVV